MALDYPWNLLGNSAGGLEQQMQQQLTQWVPALTAGSTNCTNTSYVVNAYPVEVVPLKPKGPETALEWLDRRINEVRVPLVA